MDDSNSIKATSNNSNSKSKNDESNNENHDVNEYPLKRANTSIWKDCEG